jgi:hypothetical protein
MCSVNEKNDAVDTGGATSCCAVRPATDCNPSFIERGASHPHEEATQFARGNGVIHHIRTKIRLPKPDFSMFSTAVLGGFLAALMILSIVAVSILIVTLSNGTSSPSL